jgi:hypothetical protein
MVDGTTKPVIFISYARKDEPEKPKPGEVQWRTYVQSFLAPAALNGLVHIWADEGIQGGDKWKTEIDAQLKECNLLILLVSVNSLASEVVVNFEIKTIQDRQASGETVHIYPIVLKPFPKMAVPWLMELNLRPKAGKPLSEFSPKQRDREMAAIADEIVGIVAKVTANKRASEPQIALGTQKITDATVETPGGHTLINIGHLPETAYERLVGRQLELKRLDDAWANNKINILSLVAEGGAGKSALVNEWLKRLQADNYRGAEAVLGWSFYSQGSKERATAADEFLNWALDKLGIKVETTSATAKGESIAEAMMQQRVLLVLDGVEPLQHGLDAQLGELKDQGLRALLRRFAVTPSAQAHGLIVLTSRLAVRDIAHWQDATAPVVDVERLSDEAGAALLRDNGVWGTDKELKAAAHDFEGHPLALGLLASFLKETQTGDVRRRDHVRAYFADQENPRHDHAKRVMESYEKEWLAGRPVLLAIMHLIGLFDRPASGDCLSALRAKPAIEGLTDQIVKLSDSEWQRAVAHLREARLLAPPDPVAPDMLDAHPLVREWFGERLHNTHEAVWKAAHGRLYEHLRDTTNEGKTPTLDDIGPLYQAIAHGCRAHRYAEALHDVYADRICRFQADGQIEYYAALKLGALDSDLAAVFWFFEKPYELPMKTIQPSDRTWVLNIAGFCLRAQGRFRESVSAQRAGLQLAEAIQLWEGVTIGASNLSETELLIGDVNSAVASSETAISSANRTNNKFWQTVARTTRAEALHAAGCGDELKFLFVDAERLQCERQPEYPLLYSLQGYRYCDLLLEKGSYADVCDRAARTIEWDKQRRTLRGLALDALILSRAHLGLALACPPNGRNNGYAAESMLEEAVDGLRQAGTTHYIPRGLLARAAFRRSVGVWDGAARDLDEVEEIAEPGPMRLYLCDMALERARLAFACIEAFAPLNGILEKGNPSKPSVPSAEQILKLRSEAEKQIKIAADYIEKCGYHRRDEELFELQTVLRGEKKFADLPPRV